MASLSDVRLSDTNLYLFRYSIRNFIVIPDSFIKCEAEPRTPETASRALSYN